MGAIQDAASRGDTEAMLVAMLDELARRLDGGVPARELASVTKRIMEIHTELSALRAARAQAEAEKAGATGEEAW